MAQKYFLLQYLFYLFITILCAKMSRVNKALNELQENKQMVLPTRFEMRCVNTPLTLLSQNIKQFCYNFIYFLVLFSFKFYSSRGKLRIKVSISST
jgi:hypothetical protein